MAKDREAIIVFSIGCAVFSANMVVALMVGSVGHAAQWAFAALCFGLAGYRIGRRWRNERQNNEENNGGA